MLTVKRQLIMKLSAKIKIILSVIIIILSVKGHSQSQSGYAPVNGLKMYHEVHGQGKPIVLLHGSYMNISLNWGELIPQLSKTRKVIAVEMQGHGRTADINRPFSYEAMADDVAKLLKYLKINKADVLGYSFGGTVAFEFAIKNPGLVDNLVIISSVYKYDGWLPEVHEALASLKPEFLDATPLKTEYDKIAPDPKHWHEFVKKLSDFDAINFNLGEANVKAIKSPVLFIMGDNDGVDLNHIAEMYRLSGGGVFADMTGLPKSQLTILPAQTHVTLMMQTEKIASLVNSFLNGLEENKK